MASSARLLGFAFTNADFLFEMDKSGTILFAAGAANDLVKENNEALVGKPAGKLFKPSEGIKFATFSKALKSGDRAGPYKLTLATGAEANLAMFRLPQNGTNISCSLARPGVRQPTARIDPKTGLASRDGFMAAAEKAGPDDALTLVNVPNLPEICAELPAEKASALMQRIGDTLQSCGANATGQLSETSFGAVAPAASGSLDLARKLAEAFTADGLTALAVTGGPGRADRRGSDARAAAVVAALCDRPLCPEGESRRRRRYFRCVRPDDGRNPAPPRRSDPGGGQRQFPDRLSADLRPCFRQDLALRGAGALLRQAGYRRDHPVHRSAGYRRRTSTWRWRTR